VINCAAWSKRPTVAEDSEPEAVAEAVQTARGTGSVRTAADQGVDADRSSYVSTDYVFDGTSRGPYGESTSRRR
jgi:dTDP-4-dehydrorhamnose reductase